MEEVLLFLPFRDEGKVLGWDCFFAVSSWGLDSEEL